MKGEKKKKPRGMKHKVREECKREERVGLVITVAILIVVISVSGFFIHSMLSSSQQKQETSSLSELKAAIVDHLSLTYPSQTFIQTATYILKQAGFTVDYVHGEEVTVEFFRNLPTHNYGLIIFRIHSTTAGYFFTSQLYSNTEYVYEQLVERVGKASGDGNPPFYFDIKPAFVSSNMRGRFRNATIIMMGCNGLRNIDMASAFVEKGAKVYISWDKSVSASHTDKATTHLLQHLISQKQQLKQAIDNTMKAVGPDPAYNAVLQYHPLEAGDYTIQNIKGNITTNITEIVITQRILKKRKDYEIH